MRVVRSRNLTAPGLIALMVVAACARPASPPTIPADAVPSVPTRIRTIDAATLANDAIDREGFLALLDEAGFVAATERSGTDRPHGLDRVIVRALAFDSAEGASTALAWFRAHASDILGSAEQVSEIQVDGVGEAVPVFRHTPSDCCPKATVAYLAAWREDTTVITLEMAGAAVAPEDVAAAASSVRIVEA